MSRIDPSIIGEAPIKPDQQAFDPAQSNFYLEFTGSLAAENEALKAEISQLKGQRDYDTVRATLMKRYANKVFRFLVGYCMFVGLCLLLQGFHALGFNLSDTVMAVISGSTAASAIGLVGFVVNGLFKAKAE